MRQNFIWNFILVAVAAAGASAHAGFTLSVTSTSVTVNGTPLDRWDITATNTGGDTGAGVMGLEYAYTGSRVFFQVEDYTDATGQGEPDHIPDSLNLTGNTLTRIRLTATANANIYVGATPEAGPIQWNPYMVGRKVFSGVVANALSLPPTGTNFLIMRIFTLQGGFGSMSGRIGGDAGAAVPFSFYAGPVPAQPARQPEGAANEPVLAQFGPDVSAGAPFSVTIPSQGAASLTLTSIPGIRDVVVTPSGSGATQAFIVTGRVDFSRLYNPTIVPYTLGGGFPTDAFVVFAVPEPTSVAALGLGALTLRRCRRARRVL